MAQNKEVKAVNDGIANTHDDVQVLKGIQPRHQKCYKVFKFFRLMAIFAIVIAVILFILTLIPIFNLFTQFKIFRYAILGFASISLIMSALATLDRILFLRKAPFDEWVYEIAEKRLGTSIIFYDSKHIYIHYDRSGKEVDKREFVTEMSDKSIRYSYFYIKTFIDQGIILVECKKRQPIPKSASFSPEDDKFWNIMPIGLCINTVTTKVSPIGWYLNDQNINDELYGSVPSTSILISGGTGCYSTETPIQMYNSLV